MIGTKFIKPVADWDSYAKVAEWCNANNAFIKEYEDRYEVEPIPAPTFEELKERKLNELSSSFSSRVSGSFITTHGYTMQFNESDSIKMLGAINLMEMSETPESYLVQANNEVVPNVSLATMKQVLKEMLGAYEKCHRQKQEYRAQINNCKSVYELDKIEFKWEV